jgi:hypothetical protein
MAPTPKRTLRPRVPTTPKKPKTSTKATRPCLLPSHYWKFQSIQSSAFHYLKHCEILALLASLHDLLPLMTYKFVSMLPLWRTPTPRDCLHCLVAAIYTNPHLLPQPNTFMSLLWSSRCENPKCLVKTRKLIKDIKVIIKKGFPL